jgi:uncharacterized membrane protein
LSRVEVYTHHNFRFIGLLLFILFVTVAFIFLGASSAFTKVGFSPMTAFLILVATLIGSTVNIPVSRLEATVPIMTDEYVVFFGVTYKVPHVRYSKAETLLAINVGGAIIPSIVSLYLLSRADPSTIFFGLVGVGIVSIVTHFFARPVKGIGIAMPAFIAPMAAAFVAFILPTASPLTVAYVSGVFGTLIGADLTNLEVIPELGSPIASIGGAGTFDGVFLSGIIAVLLVGL